jgi:protein-tyrosine sulfotransferase
MRDARGTFDRERSRDAVFIHGILPRSGTNFLWKLLLLHPDLAGGRAPVYEDRFLEHSDALVGFVETVHSAWDPQWGEFADDIEEQLLGAIGRGLTSFLAASDEKRLVVKNPSVRCLDRFFSLFPTGRIVVLLRDGRSVVQSSIASFGDDLASAARRWAEAAEELNRCLPEFAERSLVVRYEDLVTDLRPELERILDYCDLDRAVFDFDEAERLPVYGSSEFFGSGRTRLHWDPVARDAAFDPLRRWEKWTPQMHEEFWTIAGRQMRDLGYGDGEPA